LGSTEIIDPAAASATRSKIILEGEIEIVKKVGAITHSSGVSKCADGVGWHCRVCDCFLKDSLTYLDHINGRKHQRYLGYTMRVEKSTTTEVSGVLKSLAEKKQGGTNNGANSGSRSGGDEALDFEGLVRKKDEEALRRKAERVRRREERKRNEKEEKMHSIRSVIPLELVRENHASADEDRAEPTGIDNSVEDFIEEEEDEMERIDPNIAAMMGFSDFSGRRK
jgi:U4/U6.U5 tri-snRNP component SNU23